jgi:ATP-binding cassette subfamily B protein
LKFIFDHLLRVKRASRLPSISVLEGLEPTMLITLAALTIVVLTGLRAVVAYLSTFGFAVVANRVLTELRADLYRHLQSLALSFHTRAKGGDLIVRVIADVNLLKQATINGALPLLTNLLLVATMVGVMFWVEWKLALLVLTTLPLFWYWTARFTRRVQQAGRGLRQREGAMAATAAEAIGAIKLVQALSLEGLFMRLFCRQNLEAQQEDVKTCRLTAALGRTIGFLIATLTALVLWYGAWLVLHGELTPGELLVFLAYLKSATKPMQESARYTARLAKATAAGERVLDLLERTPEVRDLPGAVAAPPFQGSVRFDGVRFAYEPGQRVLEDINFEVGPGRRVALVGPSGIGKSTLVNLLLRLYDPQDGRVLIDGRDVREYTLASLRSQISVVLQDTLLFAASVRENIAYGAPDEGPEAIEEAARLANAHGFIQALPQGYDTVLGERGVTLSGGQRQRLAIARAALRKAPILIFDEPTTGLDEENERAVLEALERLARGRTTFLISHDLRLAARADLVLYLEDGCVLEHDAPGKLMQGNGRYATLYRQQVGTPDHAAGKGLGLSSTERRSDRARRRRLRRRFAMPKAKPAALPGSPGLNPYVFLVGCPRSGTTLLQRIVDAHPRITVTPETHWIPGYFEKATRKSPEAWVTPKLLSKLLSYRRFPQLGIGREQLEELLGRGEPVSYASFVSGIFDLYGRAQGKPLVGDKTPAYARNIPLLHGLWPNAKFVHLIRDGRDVGLSAIHWQKPGKLLVRCTTWGEDPVTTAAVWWEWHVRLARAAGQALGPGLYHEVRYEELVARPADACARLCAFLGVPYNEAMLRFHEGPTRVEPGLDAGHAWRPITPGLRDWRSQMPSAEVECFEAAAGDLLDELGYPRAVPQPCADALRRAASVRELFAKDLHPDSQASYLAEH